MINPISKWVVSVKKSYVDFDFEFETAEGAEDFYELFRESYASDKDKLKIEICAKIEQEEK